MPTDPPIEALAKVPRFSELPSRQLKRVVDRTSIDDYPEGTLVVREGG